MIDPITGLVIIIVGGFAWATYEIIKKRRESERQRREIEALIQVAKQYADSYKFENCDEVLIKKCQDLIKNSFGNDINGTYNKFNTYEERMELLNPFITQLAREMQIQNVEVRFEDLPPHCCGETSNMIKNENGSIVVTVNKMLVMYDPTQLIHTLCHEFRHVIQQQALSNNIWGFSNQRLAQWLYSFNYYINPISQEYVISYALQIIEIDAECFSEECLKNTNSISL